MLMCGIGSLARCPPGNVESLEMCVCVCGGSRGGCNDRTLPNIDSPARIHSLSSGTVCKYKPNFRPSPYPPEPITGDDR